MVPPLPLTRLALALLVGQLLLLALLTGQLVAAAAVESLPAREGARDLSLIQVGSLAALRPSAQFTGRHSARDAATAGRVLGAPKAPSSTPAQIADLARLGCQVPVYDGVQDHIRDEPYLVRDFLPPEQHLEAMDYDRPDLVIEREGGLHQVFFDDGINVSFTLTQFPDYYRARFVELENVGGPTRPHVEAGLPRWFQRRGVRLEGIRSLGKIGWGAAAHQHEAAFAYQVHGRKMWWLVPGEEGGSWMSSHYNDSVARPCVSDAYGPTARHCMTPPNSLLFVPNRYLHATCCLESPNSGFGLMQVQDDFATFDLDHNGALNMSELRKAMSFFKKNLDPAEMQMLMEDSDIDGDGEVDFKEFVIFTKQAFGSKLSSKKLFDFKTQQRLSGEDEDAAAADQGGRDGGKGV